jgi:hypothetical protein
MGGAWTCGGKILSVLAPVVFVALLGTTVLYALSNRGRTATGSERSMVFTFARQPSGRFSE